MFRVSKEYKAAVEYKIPNQEILLRRKEKSPEMVNIKQFNSEFNIAYSHGIFYRIEDQTLFQALNQKLKKNIPKKLKKKRGGDKGAVKAFLSQPKNYFGVSYLNPTCGNALIAAEDAAKNAILGLYSSELVFSSVTKPDHCRRPENAYDMGGCKIKLEGEVYAVDFRALYVSDETRFAIHFPTIAEREKLPLDNKIDRSKILTANVTYPFEIINGAPVKYFKATRNIKKGEFIAISYGDNYWANRPQPCILVEEGDKARIVLFNEEEKKYQLRDNDEFIPLNAFQEITKNSQPQTTHSDFLKRKPQPSEPERPEKKAKITTPSPVAQSAEITHSNPVIQNAKPHKTFRNCWGLFSNKVVPMDIDSQAPKIAMRLNC